MRMELKYGKNFEDEWNRLKKDVENQLRESDCMNDNEKKIIWPCYVCVQKIERDNSY